MAGLWRNVATRRNESAACLRVSAPTSTLRCGLPTPEFRHQSTVWSDTMVHAIRIHQAGGPEVMKWESVEVPAPGPGQVRLKQHAVGVNYIDVYQRSGLYKLPLPFVAGSEGAGEVVAVGP